MMYYIEQFVRNSIIGAVSFTDEKFKDYAKIKVLVDDQPVAEVKNGISSGGHLDDNVLLNNS